MLLTLLSLVPLLFMHSLYVSLICLSAGFFFAEMTIGRCGPSRWTSRPPIRHGQRHDEHGVGARCIVSPVLSGQLIDRFGNWELPFVGSMVLMGFGIVLAFRMRPESKFEPGQPVRRNPPALANVNHDDRTEDARGRPGRQQSPMDGQEI